MQINISRKFKQLFKLLDAVNYPDVDTVIMTGGRASGKSFTVALFSLIALVQHKWNVLYARYTNMSIVDSVKPEVSDKIEMLNYENVCVDTKRQIECGSNRIAFKGIKTGSKIQTANLKSLSGFNCFVVDEAEELPDFETFKKVFYSIRDAEKRNLTILILNPTTKQHWIYREFFEKRNVPAGSNIVQDNVMYIHTSYLDVDPRHIAKNIVRDYERLREENKQKYDNIVLGGLIEVIEGLLIPLSTLQTAKRDSYITLNTAWNICVVDPADKGGDNYAAIFARIIVDSGRLNVYIADVIYSTQGIEANSTRVNEKMRQYNCEQVLVEVNGLGVAAAINIKRELSGNATLIPINSTKTKEVRIASNYEFVQRHFIFDSCYESNQEFNRFVSDLTNYVEGADNNHRKDAIDVCCLAAGFVKIKFAKYLYG